MEGRNDRLSNFHFVCYHCRTSNSSWDYELYNDESKRKCPTCKNKIHLYNKHFRAPKKDNINEWIRLRILNHYGNLLYKSAPTNLGSIENYLKNILALKTKKDIQEYRFLKKKYTEEMKTKQKKNLVKDTKYVQNHCMTK